MIPKLDALPNSLYYMWEIFKARYFIYFPIQSACLGLNRAQRLSLGIYSPLPLNIIWWERQNKWTFAFIHELFSSYITLGQYINMYSDIREDLPTVKSFAQSALYFALKRPFVRPMCWCDGKRRPAIIIS